MSDTQSRILGLLLSGPKSRLEIREFLQAKSRTGALVRSLSHLRDHGFVELTIPDKPQSKYQKLKLTALGKEWAAKNA